MIYVNMRGRAGNQMFEYAAARKLAIENNDKVVICAKNLINNPKNNFPLDLCDFSLTLDENVIIDYEMEFPRLVNSNSLIPKIMNRLCRNMYFKLLLKKGYIYNIGEKYFEIPLLHNKKIYMNGYFQNAAYFDKIKQIIIRDFKPLHPLDNDELLKYIINSNSVCLTIRRGDYVSNKKNKKIFYLCDKEYYIKGIEYIQKNVKNPVIFVFSDDIEWARNNLEFDLPTFFESGNNTISEKIQLMSACKHFIISNSSFSWWAQYLSKNENKIVVAPSRWYVDNRENGMYNLQNWYLIDVGDDR